MTIGEVKSNLAMRCGTPKQHMRAQLKSESGRIVAELSDDGQLLGYYSPQDGWASCFGSAPVHFITNVVP